MVAKKAASFADFKAFTLAVVAGKRKVGPDDPKIWYEPTEAAEAGRDVRFRSLEAGAKLLSVKNRALLRAIAERKPRSISELAAMTGRADQNVLRTLNKLVAARIVRMEKGDGRARRPVLTTRKVLIEIDLLGARN